mmetsp:Transcript_132074/g.257364  ORF Transcript_132074/g.257364 Transcript_132074/m.257364 type:complete len:430 (-) Transcript_132074:23-1312(-)
MPGQPKETRSPFPTSTAEDVLSDAEKQPLLSARSAKSDRSCWWQTSSDSLEEFQEGPDEDEEWDSTAYDLSTVTSWHALFMLKRTAFNHSSLWKCFGCSMLLSTAVALVCFFVPNLVGFLNFEKLQKLSTFLNVFVGLMISFFLSSAMTRWYVCVNSFCELLDAVRTMQMTLIAVGAFGCQKERCDTVCRYGILSAWLLFLSLDAQTPGQKEASPLQIQEQTNGIWQQLETTRPHLFVPKEKTVLMQHQDSYALLWTWVASLIGRMAQDGDIPPMTSPTYGKLLTTIQQAYGCIRDTRGVLLIKSPFIFIHTLGVLVHTNNVLNAICFGLVLCASTTASLGASSLELADRKVRAKIYARLIMQLLVSMLGPVLYLAIFNVSVCVNQPFIYQEAKIPALRFLKFAELDLAGAAAIGNNPPSWGRPHFKKT